MPVFQLTGTEDMMINIREIFEKEIGLSRVSIKKRKNSYILSYQGTNVVSKIAKWLYSWNPPIYLKRKKEKFEQISKIPKYGKSLVIFKCPNCGHIGEFEKRSMYQLKKYTFKSKFCSLSCSGKFNRRYQLNNSQCTPEMDEALKQNILCYKKEYIFKNTDTEFIK